MVDKKANKKLVFISDIHIGDNSPTNWFQRSVHPPFLGKVLEYVRNNTDTIEELIILGQTEWFESLEAVYADASRILSRNIRPGWFRLLQGVEDDAGGGDDVGQVVQPAV